MIIVPGPASQELGRRVADLLNLKAVPMVYKSFPDGESYLRFGGDVAGEEVVVIQSTGPPQDTHMIQLLLMVDAAKNLGAKRVVAVVPYLAYARQDKRFLSGETFSIKTIMTLLEACRVDRVVTVNFHNPRILKDFQVSVTNLSAVGLLAKYFKDRDFEGAFSLTLGKIAPEVANQADKVLKGGYGCIPTKRDRLTGKVKLEEKPLPVRGEDVIIFDDIISSGGTISKAVKLVNRQGARRICAACVHPLLSEETLERLSKNGAEVVVATDTVPSPVSLVSVTPIIVQALKTSSTVKTETAPLRAR